MKLRAIIVTLVILSLSFAAYSQFNYSRLKLWLTSDTIDTVNNKITHWFDRSGYHYDLSQTIPNWQPTFSFSPILNHNTLCFDGNDLLNSPNLNLLNCEIFMIAKGYEVNNQYFGFGSGYYVNFLNDRSIIYLEGGNYRYFTPQQNTNVFQIHNFGWSNGDASTAFLNINNIPLNYGSTIANTGFILNDLKVGANALKGEIAEIIVFDTILNPTLRDSVVLYLQNKYAPPVRLPNDTILNTFCTITIKPQGYFTAYLWNTGETTDSITVQSTGYYKVTATDIFGRQSTDSIWVQFPEAQFASTYQLCFGDSMLITSALGNSMNYNWSNGGNQSYTYVKQEGWYYVTITDAQYCYYIDSFFVDIDSLAMHPLFVSDTTHLCEGNLLNFNPYSFPIAHYLWQPTGDTLPQTTVTQSGYYTLSVTDVVGCQNKDSIFVDIIGSIPMIDFTFDTICLGTITTFTNLSSLNYDSLLWEFGDGSISKDFNTTHLFLASGNYWVKLTLYNGACSNYVTKTIIVKEKPIANFNYSLSCTGLPTNFYNLSYSNDSIIETLWNFDGIHTSTSNNPSFIFTNNGNYSVSLNITSANGCKDSIIKTINISDSAVLPIISLYYPENNITIANNQVNFVWTASNAIKYIFELSLDSFVTIITSDTTVYNYVHLFLENKTYFWRIKAFNYCNQESISEIYKFSVFTPQTLNGLKLWLTSDTIDTVNNKITHWFDRSGYHYDLSQTIPNWQPTFSFSPILNHNTLCFDGNDLLNSPNLNLLNCEIFMIAKGYEVNNQYFGFGSGYYVNFLNDRSIIYLEGGNYRYFTPQQNTNVFQIHNFGWSNGDASTAFLNINNIPLNYGSTIANTGFILNDLKVGANALKGEIAEIIVFDTILNPTLRDSVVLYLQNKYAPPVRLPNDTILNTFCTITIKPQGYFTAYLWNTGETTDSITVQSTGYYKVTATDIFGRQSTDSIWVQFPEAQFASTYQLCFGDSMLITSALGNSMNYNWSNGGNQSYTYVKQEGWYYVTITDAQYCYYIDSFFVDIDSLAMHPLFVSDTTHLCEGNSLSFNSYNFPIAHYLWQPTGDTLPQTTVTQSGYYTLSVTDVVGCQNKDSIFVEITGKAPIANFSATHTCKGDSTLFTDLSIPLDSSPINTWQWIINNDTLNEQNPSYLFSQYGTYAIKLNVGTEAGCFQTNEQNITVHPLPICDFDAIRLCNNHATYFSSHSHIPVGSIAGLTWKWGDGTFSFDSDTTHIYALPNNYTVTLIAESDEGCIDSIAQNIEIKPSPVAGFDVSPSCNENPTFFADTSQTYYYNPIMHWEWWFGDGATSFTQHPQHVYQQSGNYIITLAIQSLNGCSDTVQKNILVSTKPQANFIADTACVHQPLILEDASSIINGTIDEWNWYVHNNFVSSLQNATLTLTSSGSLPITLIVTSNTRCTDTITKNITVYPKPSVNFDLQPTYGAVPLTVYFNNLSEFGQSYWNFGDGSTSTITQPTHNFTDTGKYTIWLTLTNIHGCKDSISKTVLVVPNWLDLAIEKIFYIKDNLFLTVQVLVANVGTLPIENPYVTLMVDGNRLVSELITDTLFSGDKIMYTFTSKIPIADATPSYICVQGQVWQTQNEVNNQNNEQCIALSEEEQLLNFYPNPAQNNIHILLQLDEDQTIYIQLTDITGKKLLYQPLTLEKSFHQLNISLENLSQGIYIIQIRTKKNTFVHKFMKE
ncbi:MAG: T9SS type A sorting domain-containing protein [Bacteroidales bacterium]|nr:T9SS type A sorting domain-containing protein [Bacteroidales bacterium]